MRHFVLFLINKCSFQQTCSALVYSALSSSSLSAKFFLWSQESSDQEVKKALLEAEDVSSTASSTPAGSPTCVSEPPSPANEAQTPPAGTAPVKPRQRGGRQRPRPISDYGQLISRTHSIPEEVGEHHTKDRTAEGLPQKDCNNGGTCENQENPVINRDAQSRRHRPLSAIGGVDAYPSNAEDKDEHLSSVSFHSSSVTYICTGKRVFKKILKTKLDKRPHRPPQAWS